jgi:hypothetical protein
MKKQHLFTLLVTIVLLAAGSLYAQTGEVKAVIPFDFTAGNMSLPAGEYSVTEMSDAGRILLIAGRDSKGFVGSHAVEKIEASANTRLVFHRYGDRYFLYQIWVQGNNRGRELPETKLEKELASNARPTLVAVLALK